MHGRACKQYIFRSHNICFQCYGFWWKSFYIPVRKRSQKGLMVSDFAHLCVVFKWRHGSEGVKKREQKTCLGRWTQHELEGCQGLLLAMAILRRRQSQQTIVQVKTEFEINQFCNVGEGIEIDVECCIFPCWFRFVWAFAFLLDLHWRAWSISLHLWA